MMALVLAAALAAAPAHPHARHGHARAPRRPAQHGPVAIPVDVGVGPAFLFANPPVLQDQIGFTGLDLSLAAVIDKALIQRNASRIPPGMRGAARGIDEVRYRPWFLALVPERLVISPQVLSIGANTGMYGAVWRPVGLGVTLVHAPYAHLSLNGGVDVAYIFIHSATLAGGTPTKNSITHFLRPGVNLNLTLEVPITKSVLVSTGWSSDIFIPQPLGRPPWEVFPLDEALWHLGGPFLMLHVRIPYEVRALE